MHRDAVLSLPPGCQNLGTSPRCGIQGLYVPQRVFTVQAHPEFDESIMSALLSARHDLGVFDDNVFEEGYARAPNKHDGLLVASVVWQFLLDQKTLQ
jgi:GMP synthase-like glutamine amidotransferase